MGKKTNFTWATAEGLPLLASDGTSQYIYGPDGIVLEQITGTTATFFHHDQQGSTLALTDANGNVVATASTDPFGNPTDYSTRHTCRALVEGINGGRRVSAVPAAQRQPARHPGRIQSAR
jgi:hypothetical protein